MLAINEEFYSIQGEGLHTGIPMYFVRLQGCDVGCYFCDTKYTWRDKKADVDEQQIALRAFHTGTKWVCITGGEPFEQDLTKLADAIHDNGMKIHVETSGGAPWQTLSYPGIDWVCLSPKDLFTKEKFQTHDDFKRFASEIKCVVTKAEDVDYYADNYYRYCIGKPLIFQPVDNDVKLVKIIFDKINEKKLFNARCMLQVHKIMEMR